ncbi:MAG: MOSC domain-containing protein [Acidimicrobiales bacterium]
MALVESVNLGVLRAVRAKSGSTGIDKVPTPGPVMVSVPGPKGSGTSGLAGDVICDAKNHGGGSQAVYAYAREDLDWWEAELGEPLRSGRFGENLTTAGLGVTDALIGETWRVGGSAVLQVTGPRIPCATFAVWMNRKGWLKEFTRRAHPGAYLRVLAAGEVQAGDPVVVQSRPSHGVTVGTTFRGLTLEPELLPGLLEASNYLEEEIVARATGREPFVLFEEVDG